MIVDAKKLRNDVRGFRGRFFYDAERGDIGWLAQACEDKQCDCEPSYNADGDIDCSVALLDDTGGVDDVCEPIVRMLNAVGPLLDEIENLNERLAQYEQQLTAMRQARDEACDVAAVATNPLTCLGDKRRATLQSRISELRSIGTSAGAARSKP